MKAHATRRLLARLREPSTWAGIAVVGVLIAGREPNDAAQYADLCALLASVAAALLPETK